MPESLEEARQALAANMFQVAENLCRTLLAKEPKPGPVLGILVEALARQGRFAEAVELSRQMTEPELANDRVLGLLSMLCGRGGRFDLAKEVCRHWILLNPLSASAVNNLGLCLLAEQDWPGANKLFDRAAKLAPERADIKHNLAGTLEYLGQADDAERQYRLAINLNPRLVPSLLNLGQLLIRRVEEEDCRTLLRRLRPQPTPSKEAILDEVESLARRVMEIGPNLVPPRLLLAGCLRLRGHQSEALIQEAIRLDPDSIGAFWALTRTRKIAAQDESLVQRMASLTKVSGEDAARLDNALGKASEDLGRYREALDYYDQFHRLQATEFSAGSLANRLAIIRDRFGREFLESAKGRGSPSERPTFVVGMPRSGTSLVEQILASHPSVGGAGELTFWPEMGARAFDPSTRQLREPQASLVARLYLRLLEQIAPGASRVVDKNPFNVESVALLHAIFPNARFLLCLRSPLDNCISMYAAYFSKPAFLHRRETLVAAYLEYQRHWRHWQELIPAERLLKVRYEVLVTNQERESRRLLEFCGLEWDNACLHPERQDRIVRTASQLQVRQPVYRSSVERWRRFEPHLGSFRGLPPEP